MTQSFGYDANGIRNTQTLNGTTTSYSINSLSNAYNSYTRGATTVPFTYDANGSITAAGSISFTYDVRGRQVSTVNSSGTTSYTLDSFGRRVVQHVRCQWRQHRRL